jgi:hypothetical protein
MVKFGILATLEAKIGKEHEVAAFLKCIPSAWAAFRILSRNAMLRS